MMWTLDLDAPPGGLAVRYPYFTGAEPDHFVETNSYVNSAAEPAEPGSYSWNHGLGRS